MFDTVQFYMHFRYKKNCYENIILHLQRVDVTRYGPGDDRRTNTNDWICRASASWRTFYYALWSNQLKWKKE